ncbi:DUF3013 family protein [Enterococcus sp. LJL98]
MAKETMLSFLDTQLTKKMADYEVALDWDAKNHTIEIVFLLFAENKEQWLIDDASGVGSEEEVIEFEDGILLYHPTKSKVNEEDYLAVLPYEGKKGMKQQELAGLVDYLKEILDEGQSDLLDFLTQEESEVFELTFDEKRYTDCIAKYAGQEQMIAYPSY